MMATEVTWWVRSRKGRVHGVPHAVEKAAENAPYRALCGAPLDRMATEPLFPGWISRDTLLLVELCRGCDEAAVWL